VQYRSGTEIYRATGTGRSAKRANAAISTAARGSSMKIVPIGALGSGSGTGSNTEPGNQVLGGDKGNCRGDALLAMLEGVVVMDVSVFQPVAHTDAGAAAMREGVAAAVCDADKIRLYCGVGVGHGARPSAAPPALQYQHGSKPSGRAHH
jgi:hypothetical protein